MSVSGIYLQIKTDLNKNDTELVVVNCNGHDVMFYFFFLSFYFSTCQFTEYSVKELICLCRCSYYLAQTVNYNYESKILKSSLTFPEF